MELKESINKYKNTALNVIVFLIAVVLALLLYYKQTKQIIVLTEKKDLELKRNDVLQDIGKLEEEYSQYKLLINNKDPSSVIDSLNEIAKKSSVRIISIRPLPEVERQIYVRYPFNLSIETDSYHALGKFISSLEEHSDIFNVETAEIRAVKERNENGEITKLTAALKINTILLKN